MKNGQRFLSEVQPLALVVAAVWLTNCGSSGHSASGTSGAGGGGGQAGQAGGAGEQAGGAGGIAGGDTAATAGTGGATVNPACPGGAADAYHGSPHGIPGTIEAEDFDPGGYSDATTGNEGGVYRTDVDVDIKQSGAGYAVGWMTAGEWLEYTVSVPVEGDYRVVVRAGAVDAGRTLELSQCGTPLTGTIAVPKIAAWGEMAATTAGPVHLAAGLQVIRVGVGPSDFVDFDSMTFEEASSGGEDTLGAKPPMGWNSWNTFQCKLDEKLIKDIADKIVSSGMNAVGYEYVNLDDCWMDGRDADGNLRWNKSKFPSGIPALAEYVHGKGLKIGIYETPNTATCVGIYGGISKSVAVGSLGHEAADAQTFASWGIDYLKYDKCQGPLSGFAPMRDALQATGRPIFLSINPGDGVGCPPNTCSLDLPKTAHMWRIGFDIGPNWGSVERLIDENTSSMLTRGQDTGTIPICWRSVTA